MTLIQLKYLLAVKNEMSINKAALACGVKQPTITAQLKKLEKELGTELINRVNYPATLTPIGELVAGQIKIIQEDVKFINEIIKKHKAGKRVKVGRPITDKGLLKAYKIQEKEINRLTNELAKVQEILITLIGRLDEAVKHH